MSHPLHERALKLSQTYLASERHLLEVLNEIDRQKIWRQLGYSSMFEYATQSLKLSDANAYSLIAISRKSRNIPKLKDAILNEQISISNAKRILPVINQSNQAEWLLKASELSTRKLEREVVIANPKASVLENISPINLNISKMTLSLSKETEQIFRQAQNLLSQKSRRNLGLEETVKLMSEIIIEKFDKVKRAERALNKSKFKQTNNPAPKIIHRKIPQAIAHKIRLRDQNRCQAKLPDKSQCTQNRFIQIHHIRPYGMGGSHHVNNLITLCNAHHQQIHEETEIAQ